MIRKVNNWCAPRIFTAAAFLCAATSAAAQDAMFVDSIGNVGIGSNSPSQVLHVLRSDNTSRVLVEDSGNLDGQTMFSLINNGHPKFRLQDTSQADVRWEFRSAGMQGENERFQINKLGSGQVQAQFLATGDLKLAGTVIERSSRASKEGLKSVNGEVLLAKLDEMPISEWGYKANPEHRHIGPMAEDFYSYFKLGPDGQHIAPKDLAGVALVAAKALNADMRALKAENEGLRKRLEELERRLSATR